MKRLHHVIAFALIVGLSMPLTAAAAGINGGGTSDVPKSNQPVVDTTSAIVQLKGDPLSTYHATTPTPGKKINFNSSAVKSYRAQLAAERNDYRKWLAANAPKAKIVDQYDISLNAVSVDLNSESLATIASAPQVQTAQYEGLYHPTGDLTIDPDLSLINAMSAWEQVGGEANAGAGVKVAIVDTGIDTGHPCFNDSGYAKQQQKGDISFTNNKVIVAKVFYYRNAVTHYTPEAVQEHGTHVAGTVACDYHTPAIVDGVTIPYGVSGVAPKALLGNYNVFPYKVTNARSEDIMNALEAAYADGFDVANMSLGGGYHGVQDLLSIAVNDLDQAGMVVAVAAGNSGPGFGTVESPGAAARALTAGASSVPHFVGAPVTVAGNTYGAAAGEFATLTTTDLTAPLAVVSTGGVLSTACAALPQQYSLTGRIALISRGGCSFSTKIRYTQDAGAVAVLVANNLIGDPVAMAEDGTPDQPNVPAYMVSLDDGQALMNYAGDSTTIGAAMQYFLTKNANIMASFSSQGPTKVDFRVKPDVVAPGVNVLSSIPLLSCGTDATTCWAFFQGTSMATPHLAGSAAVVIGAHPNWSAEQVRSAIVNTAQQGVLQTYNGSVASDVNVIGAGLDDLQAAVNAQVALDPVSVSFGAIPSGSGQTGQFNVTLTNISDKRLSLAISVNSNGDTSVAYTLSQPNLTLEAGQSATITIVAMLNKRAATGNHQANLTINAGGSEIAHAAVYLLVK